MDVYDIIPAVCTVFAGISENSFYEVKNICSIACSAHTNASVCVLSAHERAYIRLIPVKLFVSLHSAIPPIPPMDSIVSGCSHIYAQHAAVIVAHTFVSLFRRSFGVARPQSMHSPFSLMRNVYGGKFKARFASKTNFSKYN